MTEVANTNFKLRLGSFISGSFNDNSPTSPPIQSPETEIIATSTFAQMRSSLGPSLGSPLQSPGPSCGPFSSAQGVDVIAVSIDVQQAAIAALRQNWLGPMKAVLDASGTLSDVTRCHRLSRLLEVNVEAITVEEELRSHLSSVANQKLTAELKMSLDSILKESKILQEESEGHATDNQDRKALELKIYCCHESIEKILRSLLYIVTTLNNGGLQADDSAFQFDRLRPSLMNQASLETLLMALPQKYNLEVIRIP